MGETRETLAVPRGVTFVTETMLHKTKENVTNVINRLCNLHKNRNKNRNSNKLFHSPTMLTGPRFQANACNTDVSNVSRRAKKRTCKPARQREGPVEGPSDRAPGPDRGPVDRKYRAQRGPNKGLYMAPRWHLELLSGTPWEPPRAKYVNFFPGNFFEPKGVCHGH